MELSEAKQARDFVKEFFGLWCIVLRSVDRHWT